MYVYAFLQFEKSIYLFKLFFIKLKSYGIEVNMIVPQVAHCQHRFNRISYAVLLLEYFVLLYHRHPIHKKMQS